MWNEDKSVRLSQLCVALFIVLVAVCCVGAPFLLHRMAGVHVMTGRLVRDIMGMLLAVVYASAAFAAAALWELRALLRCVRGGCVFSPASVTSLRRLSWYCFGVSVVQLAGALAAWPPLVCVAAAAAFMGLMLRVLKNVLGEAVRLKNENDYTI